MDMYGSMLCAGTWADSSMTYPSPSAEKEEAPEGGDQSRVGAVVFRKNGSDLLSNTVAFCPAVMTAAMTLHLLRIAMKNL